MSSHNKRVVVIGAGISGVVAAAHIKNDGIDVTVFERSSAAGGVWFYDERKPLEPAYHAVPVSKAADTYTKGDVESRELERLLHAPPGPCYVGLKNNVSTRLLETTLNKFPSGTAEFVSHEVLKDYIQDTAARTNVDQITKYNTEVKKVVKKDEKWMVETATLCIDDSKVSRTFRTSEFDAVVVASGHYHAAKVPDIPGLVDWKQRWPRRVQHSKGYRKPEEFQGKNFLLIGGSVSSTDIARELGPVAKNIYQSHRNGAFDLSASLLPDNAVRVDEVVSFEIPPSVEASSQLAATDPIPATVTLRSGRKLCDIHHVILCTGYHLTLPFLSHLHSDDTPVSQADDAVLVTDGMQFHNLHKDIFYIKDPSLIFVGVPFFTATFTLFEFQAMVVAKVLSGQARLPNEQNMREEYSRRLRAKGYGKSFHSLRDKEEEYVNDLLEWVNRDSETNGRKKIEGYSEQWRVAREAQTQRVKALYAKQGNVRQLEVSCYN